MKKNQKFSKIKVLFNASVVLAGLRSPSGGSAKLLDYSEKREIDSCISEIIFDEIIRNAEKIDLTKSYCQGQKSLQKADLMPDAYSRPNHYYATLNGLDPAEEVKVFAYNAEEGMVECIPSLNKR